ncbi:hypothetical protein OAR75_00615 [Candidatus Pelagibacter sp.]|nr:hypothetical protein [Candidatus Pelagibacter sp.]
MNQIAFIRKISLWIFIAPFISVNLCLVLSQIFYYTGGSGVEPGSYFNGWKIFESGDAIGERGNPWIIPYFDGVASISRVVRVFPNYLIFKPAMWLTGILLIRYWIANKRLLEDLGIEDKDIKKIVYFGISSAIFLIIHSIFLGIKFDLSIYKLFRRVILVLFIIFEVTAQFYLIKIFFKNKDKLKEFINTKILFTKKILVYTLIIAAILIFPFLPFSNLKILKHILEWNYFLGVITFYLLTFFMWKR